MPGGSTSGGAISVTEAMAHAALGTDTGGSCRIPAAFTGLVGFKPTARRIPLDGGIPLSFSLDSIGSIARSVQCCATVDAFLAGEMPAPIEAISLRGLRFAVPQNFVMSQIEPAVEVAFSRSLKRLSAAGATITPIVLSSLDELPKINSKGGLAAAESYAWHRSLLAERGSQYDPQIRVRIERGAGQSAADHIDLLHARRRFIADIESLLAGFDAMLMPTVPIVPPLIADLVDPAAFASANMLVLRNPAVVNFLDGCATSVPMHQADEPPTGLMVAGVGGVDRAVLRIAAAALSALEGD